MSGQLHRSLRLPHATALVVGTIIGSAVFVQASEVTHHVPNIIGVLLVWLVGGLAIASLGVTRMTHYRTLRDLQPSLFA